MSYYDKKSKSQELVWQDRFQAKNENNLPIEFDTDVTFGRISTKLSEPESDPKWKEIFHGALRNGWIVPGGRILSNIGTRNNNGFNCFVIPVKDDLSSIFDSMKEMALIQQRGGGTGFNFSDLRPKGDYASTSHSHSSGPCSFITAFDESSNVIRSGSRRAANMAILSIYHPDIKEFIQFKAKNPGRWERFNVSVDIDQNFIDAVKKDKTIDLTFKGKVYETVSAKSLWNLLCENAWKYGDPGIIDLEMANRDFNYEYFMGEKVKATNPCSEQILHPYDQCCLGSINLVAMLDGIETSNPTFNTNRFRESIRILNRMLDNVYDVSTYPLEKNKEFGLKYRRVGMGLMGYADLCYYMGVKYSKSHSLVNKIMQQYAVEAFDSSCDLAIEKGSNSIDSEKYVESPYIHNNLPKWLIEKIKKNGIRNMNVLSIAPTGTISMFAGVSSGIEPIFAHSYERMDALSNEPRKYYHPAYEICKTKSNFKDLETAGVFETAHDISPEAHIQIHGQFAGYIDTNISKTCNLPNNASIDDVSRIFMMARDYGIKSTTVYRDGCRNQVLNLVSKETCPTCQSELQNDQNCKSCPSCGWSACSI